MYASFTYGTTKTDLLNKNVLKCLKPHCMMVLALGLVEEPIEAVVRTFCVRGETVPQDVNLLQTESWVEVAQNQRGC